MAMNMNDNHNYDEMDRDELVAIIGRDVDPDTPREELVAMAMAADSSKR